MSLTKSVMAAVEKKSLIPEEIEKLVIKGDLSSLNAEQRSSYYLKLCKSLGLNPMTQPFEYITLSGRLVLYVKKSGTDQLRQIHDVSISFLKRELTADHYIVIASAKMNKTGRVDEAMGVVTVTGLKGDALANALMKGETKAKRRATLSICGLGFLDESELDTIKNKVTRPRLDTGEIETVDYTIPWGNYKDYRLDEVSVLTNGEHDPEEARLKGYVKYIRDQAHKKGVEVSGDVKEFLERADEYLAEQVLKQQLKL